MIITDSIFQKGSSHQVCQDYALHGTDFAVGSDGCSSSPNTDVGARILCHSLAEKLKTYEGNTEVIRYAAMGGSLIAEQLHIQKESLDATLFGFEVVGDRLRTFMSGDGYMYKKFKVDGKIFEQFHTVTFEQNMPFYPNYFTDSNRLKAFRQAGTKVTKVIDYLGDYKEQVQYTWDATDFVHWTNDPLEEIELLLMFSDGLATFQRTEKNNPTNKQDVNIKEILKLISSFKFYSNGFLQRKILHGLKKEYKGWELSHWDDFSVVGLANYDT